MLSKLTYVAQPYQVGPKDRKSLAIIIPAKLTKEFDINTSSIFAIQINKQKKSITLLRIDVPNQKDMTPTDRSFEATDQQVSGQFQ